MSSIGGQVWLLFVEDPGALNYFIPLINELQSLKLPFRLYADGHAVEALKQRSITSLSLSKKTIKDCCESVSLVIVGTSENPDTLAFEIIASAKEMGISSAAIVDSGINSAYRFRGRTDKSLFHAPEYIFIPDRWTADEYVKLGFDSNKLFEIGHPSAYLEPHTEPRSLIRSRIYPPEAIDRFVLVFISEISTGLCPEQYQKTELYTLHGRGVSTLRTEIVVEELLDAISKLVGDGVARPYLILRRHPKETNQDLKHLSQQFDFISTTGNPYDLVYSADLVVGMSSALLNEAYALGSKVFAVLPRELEREWLSTVRNGNIDCATSSSALLEKLRSLLTDGGSYKGSSTHLSDEPYYQGRRLLDKLLLL